MLEGEAHNTKALVFSVKGEDLLFLDYANSRLDAGPAGRSTRRWGCPPTRSATSGCSRRRARTTRPAPRTCPPATGRSARSTGRSPSSAQQELLPFVFADAEDERAQYTMLIGQVAARLRRDAVPAGSDGAVRIRGVDPANDKIIRTFGDLVDLLEAELGDDGHPRRRGWPAAR